MFKNLLLQCWNNLIDPATKRALLKRLSSFRFTELSIKDDHHLSFSQWAN